MNIKQKITYMFMAIVTLILLISGISIYVLFSKFRYDDFHERLALKASLIAKSHLDILDNDTIEIQESDNVYPFFLPEQKIVIFGENKAVLYQNDAATLDLIQEFQSHLKKKDGVNGRIGDIEYASQLFVNHGKEYFIFIAAIDIYGKRKMEMLRNILLLVYVFSIGLVFLLGRYLAKKTLAPIVQVVKEVESIGVTNLNARIDTGQNKDEISHLASTFNRLLDRIENAFQVQKSFIANSSHELRLPLTVLSGQMQVTMLGERSNEEYKEVILSASQELSKLINLSNKLLLLAQAGSESAIRSFKEVRIDEIALNAYTDLINKNPDYAVDINISDNVNEEDLITNGNELLLTTMIYNLLENACKYSYPHVCKLNIISNPSKIVISVADEGIGIEEKDLLSIFDPFYRSSNSVNTAGSGIGLSLVNQIALLHGAIVNVKSKVNDGTTMTIQLDKFSK